MDKLDRYRGALVGGAAGDALGYAVEFMTEGEIFSRYGARGITEYALRGGKALISDDTQMTMFTAAAILGAAARGESMGKTIAQEYKGWYFTQTQPYPIDPRTCFANYSWLMNMPEMFSLRAPGNTCLHALKDLNGTRAQNNSKGCGGVMRVAPIGLYLDPAERGIAEIDRAGAEAAAVTHGHELGYIPAAALVHIITLVAHDDSITLSQAVEDSIKAMEHMFANAEHIGEFSKIMRRAVALSRSGGQVQDKILDNIHALGEGWVAEETLAIAVYCALRYESDFGQAICAAVNHKGDSDSTGAVCGNILGAYLGYSAIPEKFKANLEFHDVLLDLADDLYAARTDDEVYRAKYIAKTYKPFQPR